MVFHWSLSDSKSSQVSRNRIRILAVLSNAVVWIVSTHPPTSKYFRPFNKPLVIVPNAPITIGTIVTFMFHSFFNSLARSSFSHWSLSNSKSPQVSMTLLSIYYAVIYTISTHPVISMSSSSCTNPLVSVPRAPIITGIIDTFMFQSFSIL